MTDAELDGTPSETVEATPQGPKRRATPRRRHTARMSRRRSGSSMVPVGLAGLAISTPAIPSRSLA